jgi:hypothetical protein
VAMPQETQYTTPVRGEWTFSLSLMQFQQRRPCILNPQRLDQMNSCLF